MVARRVLRVCVVAASVAGCAGGDGEPDVDAVVARPGLQRMLEYVRQEGAPGVVALVRNRSGTWRGATGAARIEPRRAMTQRARFRVASVTKTFVATVALQLVGEGRLRLDDTVERHLPGLLPEGRRITIRQLLNHTSGLYDYLREEGFDARTVADPGFVLSPRQTVAIAAPRRLDFPPGTRWSYSNTGYQVVGLILERVTGTGLGTLLADRLFEPLRLTRTSFEPLPPLAEPVVHGYALRPDQLPLATERPRDVTRNAFGGIWADGAIVSTVDDLARFYAALLGGELLRDAQLAEMRRTVATPSGPRYGLGLFRLRLTCGYAWGHDGNLNGYLTWVLARADGSHVVVMAANGDSRIAGDELFAAARTAYCTS